MDWLAGRIAQLVPGLGGDLLHQTLALTRRRTLARGEGLLAAGEAWRDLWLVERGGLRLYYLDHDGAESNKNFFLEGQLLWPITPTLRDRPVSFFVAALETTDIHQLDHALLSALLRDLPGWTALQLQALQGLLDEKMWREQMFLQCDAQERYRLLLAARPQWGERIALRHLASWLGMTDVSLSRLRAGMGLVRR
jgi:CRP-like cAMP-binding protein